MHPILNTTQETKEAVRGAERKRYQELYRPGPKVFHLDPGLPKQNLEEELSQEGGES